MITAPSWPISFRASAWSFSDSFADNFVQLLVHQRGGDHWKQPLTILADERLGIVDVFPFERADQRADLDLL